LQRIKPFSSESNAGIYLGIAGVSLSIIGVLLSVYTLSAGEKAIWLGISGWSAALLVGIFLTIPLWKLMSELTKAHQAYAELLIRVNDLENANAKIIEINAYIISKTVRQQATKRERKPAEPHSPAPNGIQVELESPEEA
jgi:hypothetical protein